MPLKAITLHRPWPYAILRLGKRIENRGWECPLPHGAWLAIHAGKTYDFTQSKSEVNAMTLTTIVHLRGASHLELRAVWEVCAKTVNFPSGLEPTVEPDSVTSPLGVGANAWILVERCKDHIQILLDTAYGGNGQSVHNDVVEALIGAFPAATITAQNEFTGEWHSGKPYF